MVKSGLNLKIHKGIHKGICKTTSDYPPILCHNRCGLVIFRWPISSNDNHWLARDRSPTVGLIHEFAPRDSTSGLGQFKFSDKSLSLSLSIQEAWLYVSWPREIRDSNIWLASTRDDREVSQNLRKIIRLKCIWGGINSWRSGPILVEGYSPYGADSMIERVD